MFIATGKFEPEMRLATTNRDHPKGLGNRVEVFWKDKWWPAQIIGTENGRWRIHYIGFEDSWDETPTADRIRTFTPQTLPPDTRVSVHWSDGKWYPAVIRSSWYGLHFVHYDGYTAEWNEWVGIKSLKRL
jgi:hypothetical protein